MFQQLNGKLHTYKKEGQINPKPPKKIAIQVKIAVYVQTVKWETTYLQ